MTATELEKLGVKWDCVAREWNWYGLIDNQKMLDLCNEVAKGNTKFSNYNELITP